MYGSPTMSKDLNLPFPASPFKQGKDDSDLRHQQQQQQQQQQMISPGLLRYRSAPNNMIGDVCDEAAAESMFARFIAPDLRDHLGGGAGGSGKRQPSSVPASTGGFPSSDPPHMFFHSPLQPQQQIPNMTSAATGIIESSGGGGSSGSLVRHSSSPAGLFSHLNADNGFGGIRNIGGFRCPGDGSSNVEAGTTSSRLKDQISFSSRQGSSGLMSLSEMSNEGLGSGNSSPVEGGVGSARCYIPGYPVASWEDSVLLSDTFSGRKRVRDPTEAQNGEMRNHGPTLTHHFSLPKTSTEMAAMERFLQFQDAVPCKIRAKRGCATHPRSIAERVRRTRISERMRKLQELVPNMDKQTNTADMLDLAVDYIKDLQRQAKIVAESRTNCTCSSKQLDQQTRDL